MLGGPARLKVWEFWGCPGQVPQADPLSGGANPTAWPATNPGCRLYALHRAADDPTRFAILEKWDSQDDLDAHFRQPHMTGITQAVDLLEEPPQVWFTQPVAIGDPAKGAL